MRRLVPAVLSFVMPSLVLGALLLTGGCGEEPTQPIALVRFDLRHLIDDPAAPVPLAERGWVMHWLDEGWDASPDSARGVWAHGAESTARLELAGRDARLRLVLSTTPELSAAGQICTVLLNDVVLGEAAVDSGWADHELAAPIPAEALRTGPNELTLRCSQWKREGTPLSVYLRELEIVAQLTESEQEAWQTMVDAPALPDEFALARRSADGGGDASATVSDARPDVLMILLDATWAAHMSCYGYERETTPNIDALAAEGLVMERCHSVSPFTAIAVPTLLTGRHWREHGVVGEGKALADSFVTLAEVFTDAGYHTIGHSDNPYVSRGTGSDQGFAEFHEIWTDPDYGGPGLTPELSGQRFLTRARRGFGDRPVFAYLHLMPPHAPYYPGPDHDLWSDPDYDGPIDGSAEQLDRIDETRAVLSAADRERVIALYDGNLHRIDASVGEILAGWRALARDRELLVVVLSDHGEAFGEHGRYQHLSTVYDEMLHVPLVLWPREAWADLEPARSTLIGLGDVFPLLVRRLDLTLPDHLEWTGRARSLLAGEALEPATVVMRTNWHAHTSGVRTDRYLAVFDGLMTQELFDLRRDPGATRNLRAEEPQRYRELVGTMRAVLGARRPVIAPEHTVSEQERRALESLGY
jgi:arylsulfatase A-like enzyme